MLCFFNIQPPPCLTWPAVCRCWFIVRTSLSFQFFCPFPPLRRCSRPISWPHHSHIVAKSPSCWPLSLQCLDKVCSNDNGMARTGQELRGTVMGSLSMPPPAAMGFRAVCIQITASRKDALLMQLQSVGCRVKHVFLGVAYS